MNGEQPPKKDRTWLVACGIGCGALIVLGGLMAIGGYFVARKGLAQASKQLGRVFADEYAAAKADGKFSEEQEAVFGELVTLTQREGTAFMMLPMAMVTMTACTEGDEEQREQCLVIAAELRDLLRSKPNAGVMDLTEVMAKHPQFAEEFQEAMEKAGAPVPQKP